MPRHRPSTEAEAVVTVKPYGAATLRERCSERSNED
jgi:hypothetical protein